MANTPRDENRITGLVAKSDADNSTIIVEADPATKRLKVNATITGSTGGTQYNDGDATVAHPTGTIPVFDKAGTITAVSNTNPLPVSTSISTGTNTIGNVGHAADSLFTGTITANGGTVTTTPVSGMAGWTMAYYGTYSTGASLTMEASFDSGVTYQSVRMLQGSSGTLGYVITIAAVVNSTQFFVADIPSGATNLRVRCTAWAAPTGTINVIIGQSVERYATPAVGGQVIQINGLKTTNAAVPAATNLGVLPAVANATAPVFTETFQTALSTDLAANVRVVQYAATATLTNVASSATNVTLLSSNTAAKSRVVFNESTQILYLKYGVTASATSYTVQVGANAYFEFPQPTYYGQVDGLWASANGNARITEVA